jgi:chorismate mutase
MNRIKSINNQLNSHVNNNNKLKIPIIMSGPCSAETEDQLLKTALALKATNSVDVLRAGIWKPRTKPGNFEGIGVDALKWLAQAKKETGLKTAVEVANTKHVFQALNHGVDILWLGARTTVNPFSVQEIADALEGAETTVLIKNPINPDLSLWEGAIERIMNSGVKNIGVIHRGFSKYGASNYRNPPSWQIPIEMKRRYPELTMICDPSHICGNTEGLLSVSQQALDLNFDGVMLESHINPTEAWSDAKQQVTPSQLKALVDQLVIRTLKQSSTEETVELDQLRQKMNLIDDELLDALSKRMEMSDEIGLVKKTQGMQILQTGRWDEILERNIIEGKNKGLSKTFLVNFLSAIHLESINRQNDIMNNKIEL